MSRVQSRRSVQARSVPSRLSGRHHSRHRHRTPQTNDAPKAVCRQCGSGATPNRSLRWRPDLQPASGLPCAEAAQLEVASHRVEADDAWRATPSPPPLPRPGRIAFQPPTLVNGPRHNHPDRLRLSSDDVEDSDRTSSATLPPRVLVDESWTRSGSTRCLPLQRRTLRDLGGRSSALLRSTSAAGARRDRAFEDRAGLSIGHRDYPSRVPIDADPSGLSRPSHLDDDAALPFTPGVGAPPTFSRGALPGPQKGTVTRD